MTPSVVVTGGSRGIGRACVDLLLASGRRVTNLDCQPAEVDSNARYFEVDLRDPEAIEGALDKVLADGEIVGLVNNAGMSLSRSLGETSADDFGRLVPLNLMAPMVCAQRVVPSMRRAGWGRIVNISSRAASGKASRTVYAATKGGLNAMTRVWALELAADDITVNAVAPGPIATDLFNEVNPPESPETERIKAGIPVQRIGTPADVARAVAFFLDKEAGFITGQILNVCGGLTVGTAAP